MAGLVVLAAVGTGAGVGALGGDANAQLPGFPGQTETSETQPPPPPPPVSDPGPFAASSTHAFGDAARRNAVAAPGVQPPLRGLWRETFDGEVSMAVIGGGRAYVEADRRVIAVDLATGRRLWTAAPTDAARRGLAYGGGKVVAVTREGVVAIDAASGQVAWTVTTQSSPIDSNPLITGSTVLVQDQRLRAYDLATGARRWSGGVQDGTDGAPAIAGGRIFQYGGCTIGAVDARNGRVLWSRNRGCSGGGGGEVLLHGDRVHSAFGSAPVSAADGQDAPFPKLDAVGGEVGLQLRSDALAGIDLATQQQRWTIPPPPDPLRAEGFGRPFIVGSSFYRLSSRGRLEARALTSGAVTWQAKLSGGGGLRSETAALPIGAGEGVLLVISGSSVHALGAAPELPATIALQVPKLEDRVREAGSDHEIRGNVAGVLLPTSVGLEVDPYPFDRMTPTRTAVEPGSDGGRGLDPAEVRMAWRSDRNHKVRLVDVGGAFQPSAPYTVYVFPRIRIGTKNIRNRIRASISVVGSGDIRYRRRKVHLYIARDKQRRMVKLGSARLAGPKAGKGRGVVRFRALRRVGRRDYLFACVPGVHRLGQGLGDVVQRRCGRRTIRF